LLKNLFGNSAPKKSAEIQKLMKQAIEEQGVKVKFVSPLGFKYDSAFWFAVTTDAERDRLQGDEALLRRLNDIIRDSGYLKMIEEIWEKEIHNPILEYLKTPGIVFESQETVDRDFKGNWYYRMK
jgi:hypothetical protein